MTASAGEFARVRGLLARTPGVGPWAGASPERIAGLEAAVGHTLPAALRAWLAECDGVIAGPGSIYGVDEIVELLGLLPEWRDRGWVLVANDGCGDHYVVDAASGTVFFVDQADLDVAAYAVGSGLSVFLEFLLESELGERRWPFDASYVLDRDPALAAATPLPWEAT